MERLKTRQEIAEEYGICVKTLNRIIEENNLYIQPRKLVKPPQQIEIRNIILGIPIITQIVPNLRKNDQI